MRSDGTTIPSAEEIHLDNLIREEQWAATLFKINILAFIVLFSVIAFKFFREGLGAIDVPFFVLLASFVLNVFGFRINRRKLGEVRTEIMLKS